MRRNTTQNIKSTHLRQRIEYVIEEQQNLPLGHLGDVVHTLARIVSNPCILIREARQNRRYNLFEVRRNSLLSSSNQRKPSTLSLSPITHRSKRDRGGRQTNQAAISCMGLMHGIGVVMAELLDDFPYLLVLPFENGFANDLL